MMASAGEQPCKEKVRPRVRILVDLGRPLRDSVGLNRFLDQLWCTSRGPWKSVMDFKRRACLFRMALSCAKGATRMSKVWIGTSGWTYDGWRGPFYPTDLTKTKWLCWYASQFPTTEINGSFYRTPSLKAVAAWRDQTPKDFLFAWKASKFITHWKRLSENCANSIELMETRLKALSPKVGAVLFQLPPQFSKNRERLASFLGMLPRCYPYAFEFRHKSWYDDDIYQLLCAHDVSLCLSDHHDAPSPWEVTARHVYLRGHGPNGRYKDHYPDRTLRTWARHIGKWRRERRTVFVYFDNDQKSAAPTDARRLCELLHITHTLPKGRCGKKFDL